MHARFLTHTVHLIRACLQLDTVKCLVENHAYVEMEDNEGYTAEHFAQINNFQDIQAFLAIPSSSQISTGGSGDPAAAPTMAFGNDFDPETEPMSEGMSEVQTSGECGLPWCCVLPPSPSPSPLSTLHSENCPSDPIDDLVGSGRGDKAKSSSGQDSSELSSGMQGVSQIFEFQQLPSLINLISQEEEDEDSLTHLASASITRCL